MNMLTNIIRGGQLSLHALRMFKQVCITLVSWCVVVWLLIFSFKMYNQCNINQVNGYIDYNLAAILKNIGLPNKDLTVQHFRTKNTYAATTVLNSPYFMSRAGHVNSRLLEAASSATTIISWLFAFLSCYFVYRGLKRSGEHFKRGADMKLFKQLKSKIKARNHWQDGYTLAGMPYPKDTEESHTLIIGATGAGKTVLISDLVEQIRKRGDRAIIFDKKCDFTSWFYDPAKDFILNPFDRRGVKWNLLGEVENTSQLKTIAECFIPNKGYYSGDSKIWDEAAKIVFTSVVEKLLTTQNNLTNREIAEKILKQDLTKIAALVKGTYAEPIIDLNSPKTASSVMFVLATYFNSLRIDHATKEESFSIRNWIKTNDNSMLFITSPNDIEGDLKPLQTAWLEIAISSILSSETKRKTWLILDELPTLQRIPSLAKGLAVSRSYGGCFVLGIQNIAQMKDIYGMNGTQNISAECNTRCIFRTNDPETAKWMTESIGYRETKEYAEGLSYGSSEIRDGVSLNEHEKLKALVLPSEIQSLPNLSLYLKMANNPITKAAIAYKERTAQNEKFVQVSDLSFKRCVEVEVTENNINHIFGV